MAIFKPYYMIFYSFHQREKMKYSELLDSIEKELIIRLYTMQVNEAGSDWEVVYLEGDYTWDDPLVIALDEERPVYGYELVYNNIRIQKPFKTYEHVGLGKTLNIPLNIEEICELFAA